MILRDLLRRALGWHGHNHTGGIDGPAAVGIMPLGTIIAWHGAAGSIPMGWRLCDGGGGTPDWRDRWIRCSWDEGPGTYGGQGSYDLTHAHGVSFGLSAAGNHSHTGGLYIYDPNARHGQMSGNSGTVAAASEHTHSVTWNASGDYHGHGVSAGSYNNLTTVDSRPQWYGLFYCMRVAVPTAHNNPGWGYPVYNLLNLQAWWRRLWEHDHSEANIGTLPVGAVVNFTYGGGTPSGWAECNGGNGTPDLRNKYVVSAGVSYGLGSEGGANTKNWYHGHSAYASSDAQGYHGHSMTVSGGQQSNTLNRYNDESYHHTNNETSHSHPLGDGAGGGWGHTLTCSLDAVAGDYTNEPYFVTLRYLKRVS